MRDPIYVPAGRAGEYGDYALNIYTGCPHGCYYCYAAKMAHRWGKDFTDVKPREGLIEALDRQLGFKNFRDKTIHLCFSCDPYPHHCDTIITREVIQHLKQLAGAHVQILTKGLAVRDFDLLDDQDWFGITYSCDTPTAVKCESGAVLPHQRLAQLEMAKEHGIKTWVSFEPVINPQDVIECIQRCHHLMDKVKIGKLNYYPSDVNWAEFGREAEALCQSLGIEYYIKDDLRAEMDGTTPEKAWGCPSET